MDAARQAEALAQGERLSLLHLVVTDAEDGVTAERLAGPGGDAARVRSELEALAEAGLLQRSLEGDQLRFRATHDALARFAGLFPAPAGARGPRIDDDHAVRLRHLAETLEPQFRGTFEASTVRRYVYDSYLLLASRASVRHHLIVLTERFATERLQSLAKEDGAPTRDVLFVCTRNAARSQMAAAITRGLAGDRIRVHSAGSAPGSAIDPVVARVLVDSGFTVMAEFPKPLTEEVVRGADHIITLGCGDTVPLLAGRRYADWTVRDPAGMDEDAVRRVLRDIERRVTRLVEELEP